GEVDVLEDALQALTARKGAKRPEAGVRDDQELAGLDVALPLRLHEIERARLRGDHVRVAEMTEGQRTEAVRVADSVHRGGRQDEQRVGALDLLERVDDLLLERPGRRPRQEV